MIAQISHRKGLSMRFYLTKFREYVGFSPLRRCKASLLSFSTRSQVNVSRGKSIDKIIVCHKNQKKKLKIARAGFPPGLDGGILHGPINCSSHAGPSYFACGV